MSNLYKAIRVRALATTQLDAVLIKSKPVCKSRNVCNTHLSSNISLAVALGSALVAYVISGAFSVAGTGHTLRERVVSGHAVVTSTAYDVLTTTGKLREADFQKYR